jgi:hypothetical protein
VNKYNRKQSRLLLLAPGSCWLAAAGRSRRRWWRWHAGAAVGLRLRLGTVANDAMPAPRLVGAGGGGSAMQLVLLILQGKTPRPQLMRRHGWWLILVFFVPTLLLDVRSLLLRRSDDEEADLERQREKHRNRIDRIIVAAAASGPPSSPAQGEFSALAHAHLAEYGHSIRAGEAGAGADEGRSEPRIKWETVRDCTARVRQFEKASKRTVAALVVLSRVLVHELDTAIRRCVVYPAAAEAVVCPNSPCTRLV